MRFEVFRQAWARIGRVAVWGVLVSVQVVMLIPLWSFFAVTTADLEEWVTIGVPSILALIVLPFFGALVGARLFSTTLNPGTSWLDQIVVGFIALAMIPLPAEAIRWALMTWLIESPTRAQSESWMFLLLSIPITTICLATATVFAQFLRRFWPAALAGFLAALVLMLGTLVALYDSELETDVLVISSLIAALLVLSALLSAWSGAPTARGLRLPAAVGCVLGATAIGLWQYTAFERQSEDLRSTQRQLAAIVENAKTTAARLDEFRLEVERKEAVLATLRRMLPESLDVAEFFDEFRELAKEHELTVVQNNVTTHQYDFYEESILTIELEGDEHAITELESRAAKISLINHWRYLDDDSRTNVALSVFAAPRPPNEWARPRCPEPDGDESTVWLWPWADRLAADRERIDVLCTELGRLEPIADAVGEYQGLLAELEEVTALVEALQDARKSWR